MWIYAILKTLHCIWPKAAILAAARAMHVSPSTLSRQIQRLEEDLEAAVCSR